MADWDHVFVMASQTSAPLPWRLATAEDAGALRDLERAANLVGLAHVFPVDRFPFPDAEVLARWVQVLADPEVRVEVAEAPVGGGRVREGGLIAYTAYDARVLRHLAVRPDHWGTGLARIGVERAVAAIADAIDDAIKDGGERTARLWCLEANHRARGLYEHLGWAPNGRTQNAPWPPHPTEWEFALNLG